MNDQDFEAYADHKRFDGAIAGPWQRALADAVQASGKPLAQLTLLDYGCGDGKYFTHLVQAGAQADKVHGLEVSARRVARCRQLGWAHARLLEPGAALPYPDGMFDIVNCIEVIEHIPAEEGRRIVAELRRVLRPSGTLLIATPNYPVKRFYDVCDAVLHGKWTRLRDDPTHVTRFNQALLRGVLQRSFGRIEPRPYKSGFLHKRLPKTFLLHKLFFLCRP